MKKEESLRTSMLGDRLFTDIFTDVQSSDEMLNPSYCPIYNTTTHHLFGPPACRGSDALI